MKTLKQFEVNYKKAIRVRFDCFDALANFELSYPEYQHGLDYNYYIRKREDEEMAKSSFLDSDTKARWYIEAYNKGDFKSCVEHFDF